MSTPVPFLYQVFKISWWNGGANFPPKLSIVPGWQSASYQSRQVERSGRRKIFVFALHRSALLRNWSNVVTQLSWLSPLTSLFQRYILHELPFSESTTIYLILTSLSCKQLIRQQWRKRHLKNLQSWSILM